ncbi:fatty acyl-CoA reductase wat-like [Drosophila kikkawai]|uniref:Fatty acyl-CoA reductase n=1 Tax=Drosophila kikkawai TaxID=30033 RepID=A0A6P4J3P5_DROKI|nr:fatty acyl-CoA reductase wat-like [Drosophila kikkawai]
MDTGIQEFFRNKTVFLTGGSGFLGKVVIEKLLRTTEVKRIYSLFRPKRGVSIGERVSVWEKDSIFEVLLKTKPDALQRVCPIAGDCQQPDLGLCELDKGLLVSEVQVVIHGAATVRFDEAMHLSLAINVRATRLMLQLAKRMTQLVSFVHVSTAYSNSVATDIDERFYPEHLRDGSDKILALGELLSAETIDNMTSALVGSFPNTYTYTKALAEDVIRREAGNLCIFRPSIIMPVCKEPEVGWTEGLNGPQALIFGIARGVVRVLTFDSNSKFNLVPVDYCANVILACAWTTGTNIGHAEKPPIYTFGSTRKNQLCLKNFLELGFSFINRNPLNNVLWYPFLIRFPPLLFPFAAFFFHTLPGYFLDALLRLNGRKPILGKVYSKIHKNIALLGPFMRTTFNFGMSNTQGLLETLSKKDRFMYDFDMDRLDWDHYFQGAFSGMRKHIANEPITEESIASGLKLHRRFKVLHYGLTILLLSLILYGLWMLAKFVF